MAQEIAAAGGIVSAADLSSAAPVIQAPLTAQVRAMTRTSRQGAVNPVQWTALSKQLLSWLVDGALKRSLCTTGISDPDMRLRISCRGKCHCALLPQHSSILWLPVLGFLSSTSRKYGMQHAARLVDRALEHSRSPPRGHFQCSWPKCCSKSPVHGQVWGTKLWMPPPPSSGACVAAILLQLAGAPRRMQTSCVGSGIQPRI